MSDAHEVSMPAFPPTAHRMNPKLVSEQPMAGSGMVVAPSNDHRTNGQTQSEEGHSPMRLRGGCFPLPGGGRCYIIPIPCCC
ncbi:hypothetical protein K435DRAFT_959469 [Dendrothele bispora CBS 962.96]|uniref:Uncharacterized protein n=1 Tax=Dendrothele bispora (strain CBS 962.96) TaxID=1314807 RepID=A0A4S8MY02_DENBC|nr:hypothetical protein K435DRAFT_959469 [Dendrothele bispora CBS 962.96]